jgi:hypothetical protein
MPSIKTWIGTDGNYGTAANFSPAGVPGAGDTVRLIPGRGGSISSGLAATANILAAFIVERGCPWLIGSRTLGPLQIKTQRFEYAGTGESWFDLSSQAVDPRVMATASVTTGYRGLYLVGSALGVLDVIGGSVGVAVNPGETATLTTARVAGSGGDLWLGAGTSLTNLDQHDGECRLRCALAALSQMGGDLVSEETGAITAGTLLGGTFQANSTGTIAAITIDGGALDMLGSDAARIISALTFKRGTFNHNPQAVTVSAWSFPNAGRLSFSK